MRGVFVFFCALAVISGAAAQQATIGVISYGVAASSPHLQAFRDGLRELGYVEGKNLRLEFRFAQGFAERLPGLAGELARLKVNVIVTEGVPTALAARRAAANIPIVMAGGADPVAAGLAASLARPGGNVTGLTFVGAARTGKQLQLLKETVPSAASVAVIYNPLRPDIEQELQEARETAHSVGVTLVFLTVRTPAELEEALQSVARMRPSAMITIGHGMLLGLSQRIGDFALKQRLPGAFPEREFALAGGLLAYGPDLGFNFRRAASYVDKILKGAKPADLPIERPAKWGLIVNMRAAKEIGVKVPGALLVRADELIE